MAFASGLTPPDLLPPGEPVALRPPSARAARARCGLLSAAPAAGALLMGFLLARFEHRVERRGHAEHGAAQHHRQLQTPDCLRGRMTSVNTSFFMGGPQLGEFEAGLVAQGFGAPFSVVTGGLGCLAATALVARRTPELVTHRRDAPPAAAA